MSAPTQSEAVIGAMASPPGQAWAEIIRRPSLDAFSAAFSPDEQLEGSVFAQAIVGPKRIRQVFDATRGMYDAIAFHSEVVTSSRVYLEWQGLFMGEAVAGVTVLSKNDAGLIEQVRLYHRPKGQVEAFSTELHRLISGDPT